MFREPDDERDGGFVPGIEERYVRLMKSRTEKQVEDPEPAAWVDFSVHCFRNLGTRVRRPATKIADDVYVVEPFEMRNVHGCKLTIEVSWTTDQPDDTDLREHVGTCIHGDLEIQEMTIHTGQYIQVRCRGETE